MVDPVDLHKNFPIPFGMNLKMVMTGPVVGLEFLPWKLEVGTPPLRKWWASELG